MLLLLLVLLLLLLLHSVHIHFKPFLEIVTRKDFNFLIFMFLLLLVLVLALLLAIIVEIHFFSLHHSLCSLPFVRLKPRSSHAHKVDLLPD
jgi:hypothetical protein